jgi:ketosteroid isomerase-like protein
LVRPQIESSARLRVKHDSITPAINRQTLIMGGNQMRMWKLPFFLSTLFALNVPAASGAPPDWFLNEIAALTAEDGRWVADNSPYKSEQEPYDFYVTEWRSSFNGTTMTGRLYGILDGEQTPDFWEFRQYWHPGRQEGIVEQFGWGGAVGIGTIRHEAGVSKSEQMFYSNERSPNRTGHVSHFSDRDTYVTKSFTIDAEDNWLSQREYAWQRARDPEHRTEADVEAAVRDFIAAIDRLDIDSLTASFTADATVFYPFSFTPERLDGREAIREAQQRGFDLMRQQLPAPEEGGTLTLRLQPTDMRVRMLTDDAAVATWHSNRPGRAGRRTSVLQRVDGRWLTVSHHASNMTLSP